MKRLLNIKILAGIAVVAIGIFLLTNRKDWSTTEVLEGYDAEAEIPAETIPTSNNLIAGTNPPHGQPGHRCDIPVGASLSTPLKTATDTSILNTNTTTTQQQAPVTTLPSNASGKVNPPHGQTGHRCDLPVGAALPQ